MIDRHPPRRSNASQAGGSAGQGPRLYRLWCHHGLTRAVAYVAIRLDNLMRKVLHRFEHGTLPGSKFREIMGHWTGGTWRSGKAANAVDRLEMDIEEALRILSPEGQTLERDSVSK